MTKLLFVTGLLLVAAFIPIPPTAFARGPRGKKGHSPEVDTSDRITALHLTSITITVYSTHASKEYKVTPVTKITLNGKPATLSSLSTGMGVSISPASDPSVAAAIDAESPQKK